MDDLVCTLSIVTRWCGLLLVAGIGSVPRVSHLRPLATTRGISFFFDDSGEHLLIVTPAPETVEKTDFITQGETYHQETYTNHFISPLF